MRQMRWTVSVQRDGEVNGEPLATFTRPVDGATVADFGPSLEEGRHLLKVLQETIVQSQIRAYDNARRRCRHCGAYRRIKDWRERLVATTLGEVRVRVPRVVSCLCTPEPLDDDDLPTNLQRLSECPIHRLIPGRRTPGAVISVRQTWRLASIPRRRRYRFGDHRPATPLPHDRSARHAELRSAARRCAVPCRLVCRSKAPA